MFALCLSNPVALDLDDVFLPMLHQITDGVDVGVGQLRTQVGLVSLPDLSCLLYQGELSSIVPTSSPFAAMSKGRGHFYFHTLKGGSPIPTPLGPALLCCPGEVYRPLS